MATYNRDKKYTGHTNEEIFALDHKLDEIKEERRRIVGDIQEIRENCDHEFLFWCSGMYDDTFYCEKCGEENR